MSKSAKRYSFFNVLVVVAAINLLLVFLGLIITWMVKIPESTSAMEEMFSLPQLAKQLLGIICETLFFYYSLNYYNKLIIEKEPFLRLLRYSLLLLLLCFVYFSLMHYFPRITSSAGKKLTLNLVIISSAISGLFFVALSMLLAYLNSLRDEKKVRQILEEQKLQLEVDKSQANFKFLKSQINPHFLHNTLNFLYAKSLPYSPELSEGILTLSDIMRYALNENTGSDGKALLKDEIEHVRNVIKINQLRFSNNLHVNFEVNGVINGAYVIPFLLITVVENAFKHGDLQSELHPIQIKLVVEQNRLYFYCRNKKKSGPKEISTGLGLDNIRNRLAYTYGDAYQFLIKDEADFYTTELTIDKL